MSNKSFLHQPDIDSLTLLEGSVANYLMVFILNNACITTTSPNFIHGTLVLSIVYVLDVNALKARAVTEVIFLRELILLPDTLESDFNFIDFLEILNFLDLRIEGSKLYEVITI